MGQRAYRELPPPPARGRSTAEAERRTEICGDIVDTICKSALAVCGKTWEVAHFPPLQISGLVRSEFVRLLATLSRVVSGRGATPPAVWECGSGCRRSD